MLQNQKKVSEHCVRDEKGARSAQKRFIKACVLPLYDKLGQVKPRFEAVLFSTFVFACIF